MFYLPLLLGGALQCPHPACCGKAVAELPGDLAAEVSEKFPWEVLWWSALPIAVLVVVLGIYRWYPAKGGKPSLIKAIEVHMSIYAAIVFCIGFGFYCWAY